MSVIQGNGFRRNGSVMTGYRHDRLPFSLEKIGLGQNETPNETPPEPALVKRCPRPIRMGFCVVRLCPRAAARIEFLLALPELNPDVKEVCEGLLAWARKYGGYPAKPKEQTEPKEQTKSEKPKGGEAATHRHRKDDILV